MMPPVPAITHSIDLKAVIYIGASSVAMLITNRHNDEEVEFLERSIPIASDIFSRDRVSKSTLERAVKIIHGYLHNINEYGPQDKQHIRIVATNILYEANNKEQFITRLRIAFNQEASILDDGEMTRLLYLKTRRRLKKQASMQTRTTLVVHVGPGNTRAILFHNGSIVTYKSYRLGAHRTAEAVHSLHTQGADLLRVIREHSSGQISALVRDFANEKIEEIVMIGYEIQSLSESLPLKKDESILIKHLDAFSNKLARIDIDQIVQDYPFDYQAAEAVLPAVEITLGIVQGLDIKTVRVTRDDYERNFLNDLSHKQILIESFENEVIQSVFQLSEKFHIHAGHAQQVCKLCETLFSVLQASHQLTQHDLLLLRAAAILHEAGGFIHAKAHHKHSLYLIMHSEIFGLSQHDVNIIALTARYHRNSIPKPTHLIYKDLSSADQIRLTKLAAILRVADALDRTHIGRAHKVDISIKKRKLLIELQEVSDASIERLAMKSKGGLLQDIFGLEINILESTH